MASDNKHGKLRVWLFSADKLWAEIDKTKEPFIDSSSAWGYYEPFLNSHGYSLIFHKTPEPCHPKVDLSSGLGDPFNPFPTGPFVHHVPENLEFYCIRETDPWQLPNPRVTLAYDRLDRLVVIKALPASKAQSEIDQFSYLRSPLLCTSSRNHTIPLLEVLGPEEEWWFLVMPAWRMEVESFLKWEVDEYFNLVCQSLEGLAFMHENGIAHRDISPINLVINQDGTQFYTGAKVKCCMPNWDCRLAYIDFGISSRYDPVTDSSTWMDSRSIGNPWYVAPEVASAKDTKKEYQVLPADVYALGNVWTDILREERDLMRGLRAPPSMKSKLPDLYAGELLMLVAPQFDQLLAQMMDVDAAKRTTASEALERFQSLRAQIPEYIRFAPLDGYDKELISAYVPPDKKDTILMELLRNEFKTRPKLN